jgi:hypothetical protein
MEQEIINCFELDVRRDIPAEMELVKLSNRELKKSNQHFRIILLTLGLGAVLYAVYQSSKQGREKK